MPPNLQPTLDRMAGDVAALMERLELGTVNVTQWRDEMRVLLARYHQAAMMIGLGTDVLPPGAIRLLEETLTSQTKFLDNFATVIRAAPEFQNRWKARARLYAMSPGSSFWEGDVYRQAGTFLPLPAMPRDGTSQCVTNDKCRWKIDVLDAEAGNYNATWILDATVTDHCQTCLERSEQWSPLRIRGGILQ